MDGFKTILQSIIHPNLARGNIVKKPWKAKGGRFAVLIQMA